MVEEFLDIFFKGDELAIAIGFVISIVGGFLIGVERESRGKSAGISTYILVIAGSMMFTYLSANVDPYSTSRIASYVVAGIGFLGGGMIIRGEGKRIFNLTTAASIWCAAAIGMALGYEYYFLAVLGIILSILGPRIPSITKKYSSDIKQKNKDD
ncbi:MAG: MgtC/SapB family protein [Nitrosopumilus sp.]|uniref:MgtC/SapB family protein n=1 Tax=Nitrosopumilus sp. TaxID=2024843 RepID=UPI00246B2009|nr:MgtC/SapB family protein [Nitrosopumilus sp.]MDH5431249.1 MgtC/SapB family protein [Nitrosopumilus sp.]MDH5698238.1 MgtC/SapB family protein [Nitrosopumilus sp.]